MEEAFPATACDLVTELLNAGDSAGLHDLVVENSIDLRIPTQLPDRLQVSGYTCAATNSRLTSFGVGFADHDTLEGFIAEEVRPDFRRERLEQLEEFGPTYVIGEGGTLLLATAGPIDDLLRGADMGGAQPLSSVLDALVEHHEEHLVSRNPRG